MTDKNLDKRTSIQNLTSPLRLLPFQSRCKAADFHRRDPRLDSIGGGGNGRRNPSQSSPFAPSLPNTHGTQVFIFLFK